MTTPEEVLTFWFGEGQTERALFDHQSRWWRSSPDFDARRHAEIIERFGRYPHRNAALGRRSTDEELAFLAQPGSSF